MTTENAIPLYENDESVWFTYPDGIDEVTTGDAPRRMVRNVSTPSLEVGLADPTTSNGTAIIICPGGAFHMLSMDNEGYEVKSWLNSLGITTFILRYRLVPTPTDDGFEEVMRNPTPHRPKMDAVRPLVIADALQSVRTVRARAAEWNVDPAKIGMIGFSAGAWASVGAAARYLSPEERPDFAASIYGEWWERWIPNDAPPLFISACSNDPLIDVPSNTSLYETWYRKGLRAELHLYSQGGHGYGIREQGLPVDAWSAAFERWLAAEGFLSWSP